MSPLRPLLAAAALLLVASPALGQSAEALAAREVTPAEEAYLAEHFAGEVDAEVDTAIVQLRGLAPTLHAVFAPSLHAEIDAVLADYFEGQRPDLRTSVMRALAESMTLDEMRGLGLNTRRSLEISAHLRSETQAIGQRMGIGALRHLCSAIGDRAPDECGVILQRAAEMEAQFGA